MTSIAGPTFMRSISTASAMAQMREIAALDITHGAEWERYVESALAKTNFTYDPTSSIGQRWQDEDYLIARQKLIEIMNSVKTEAKGSSTSFGRILDCKMYETILDIFPMTPYEASQRGVWEYLTMRVIPDLVSFRWQGSSESSIQPRYFGGDRNALKRIWIRAYASRGDLSLLDKPLEDNLTAIFERPKVIANPAIAMAVLVALNKFIDQSDGKTNLENQIRDALLRLRRIMSVRSLDVLEHLDLQELIDDQFRQASLAAELAKGGL